MPRLILLLAILSLLAWVPPAPAASPPAEDWAIFDKPGKFITALCATDEALWVGTEDRSLWRLDLKADPAKAEAWQQFTSKDTATDHVYGIAIDSLGRVWVGTLNQGVSVFNGKEWRNYGVLDGCSGERVFAIAADKDPKRGNVWIGTDDGLTSWTPATDARLATPAATSVSTPAGGMRPDASASPAKGAASDGSLVPGVWRTYTRADGLPSDQIYAVAVAPKGRVWVGTECDGLAWSDPPYKRWSCIRAAAERSGDAGEAPRLFGGTAPGLPSNLTNDLVLLPNETVVVSTNYGMGVGNAGGQTWTAWQGLSKQPYENYSRGLAVDGAGSLWIATRHKGLARMDLGTGKVKTYQQPTIPDNYVFAVATTPSGDIWAGTYGGGLARLKGSVARTSKPGSSAATASANPKSEFRNPKSAPPLPGPQGPPTLDELNAMLADLAKVPFVPPEKQPAVVRLGDDWLTQGDWLGRYGRFAALLCAIRSPYSHLYGVGWQPGVTQCIEMIGPNCTPDDSVRYWVHWLYSRNPRALEIPPDYLANRILNGFTKRDMNRRQAELDDHGEAYPMSKDGPHLFLSLHVPPGEYALSLYFFNKDGESGANRWRDYSITIKGGRFTEARLYGDRMSQADLAVFEGLPTLAKGRVKDFRGGVYKRFAVRGPGWYGIRIGRNHSFNTNCSALMLDLLREKPAPYYWPSGDGRPNLGRLAQVENEFTHSGNREKYLSDLLALDAGALALIQEEAATRHADFQARFAPCETADKAATNLFGEMTWLRLRDCRGWADCRRKAYLLLARHYAARVACAQGASGESIRRLGTCLYELGIFPRWEQMCRQLGVPTAREMEIKALDEYLRYQRVAYPF